MHPLMNTFIERTPFDFSVINIILSYALSNQYFVRCSSLSAYKMVFQARILVDDVKAKKLKAVDSMSAFFCPSFYTPGFVSTGEYSENYYIDEDLFSSLRYT